MTREEAIERIRDHMFVHKMYEERAVKITEALKMAISALEQLEPCEDVVSKNVIIQKLNMMDRYVSEGLRLCGTDKKFPKNEVFIVDDVYEEIVENFHPEPCDVCKDLEEVDTLHYYTKWHDGGINFHDIKDIKFCPKCGRRL